MGHHQTKKSTASSNPHHILSHNVYCIGMPSTQDMSQHEDMERRAASGAMSQAVPPSQGHLLPASSQQASMPPGETDECTWACFV